MKNKIVAIALSASCLFSVTTFDAAASETGNVVSSECISSQIVEANPTLKEYAADADEDPGYLKYYNSCLAAENTVANTSNSLSYGKYSNLNRTWGIDVSRYQGNVDWSKVKASGIDYVIIRAGYRGYGDGDIVTDSKYSTYISGAQSAGLDVGVYFYSQAINRSEGIEEAKFVLSKVKDQKIDYPIYIDMEYASSNGRVQRANLSKSQMTDIADGFCKTIEDAGYESGLYSYKSWLMYNFDMKPLEENYSIWLAHWTSSTDYTGDYDMWQYTSSGSVNGITGNVDKNVYFVKNKVTTTTAPAEPEENFSLGDVTGDGIVDPLDATDILIYSATVLAENANGSSDKVNYFTDKQKVDADVNFDGVIDSVDATAVLIYAAHSYIGETRSMQKFMVEEYKVKPPQHTTPVVTGNPKFTTEPVPSKTTTETTVVTK